MKLLQINTVCGNGSTGKIAVEIQKYCENKGASGCIIYGRECKNAIHDSVLTQNKYELYANALSARLFDNEGFGANTSTKRMIDYIKEYQPDIIQLHNLHGYYVNLVMLFQFLKEYGKPVVWTLHDCWAFTGHCTHYAYFNCDKWKRECGHCIQKSEYPRSLFIDKSRSNYIIKKNTYSKMDNLTLVVPSMWMKSQVEKSFLSKYNINVIYNGIDLALFKKKKTMLKHKLGLDDKIVLLGVADGFGKKKGLDNFIKLYSLLDHNRYSIILVGLKTNQITELPKGIIGLERTRTQEELVHLYSITDLFLNLSREESMGLVTVEALACGVPALVNDATALPEIIEKSGCGMIIDYDNMEQAAQVISKEEFLNISEENCRKYAQEFDKSAKYQQYYELYTKLYKTGGKG